MRLRNYLILACLFLSTSALAQPGPNDVFVRVADTGAALCCIVRMPGNHYMVYDAGNWTGGGALAFSKVQEIIPAQSDIELLVLSHSDSDHLGAVDEICTNYNVKRVLRSGYVRDSGTWTDANDAIIDERDNHGCIEINLRTCEFPM